MRRANIQWAYSGAPNPFVGTGATGAETALGVLAGLAGAGFMFYLAADEWVGWGLVRTVIAALIAFDLIGGAVANQLNSAKRYYHAPTQPEERGMPAFLKTQLMFQALHVHPIVIYLLFKPDDFWVGIGMYLGLAAASAATFYAPLYLSRPLGTLFVVLAIMVNAFAIHPIPGFDWLLPVLAIKLVLGHAVREEPYRPLPNPNV